MGAFSKGFLRKDVLLCCVPRQESDLNMPLGREKHYRLKLWGSYALS